MWVGASSIPSVLISCFHKADSSQPREKWIKWRSSWKARGRGLGGRGRLTGNVVRSWWLVWGRGDNEGLSLGTGDHTGNLEGVTGGDRVNLAHLSGQPSLLVC